MPVDSRRMSSKELPRSADNGGRMSQYQSFTIFMQFAARIPHWETLWLFVELLEFQFCFLMNKSRSHVFVRRYSQ